MRYLSTALPWGLVADGIILLIGPHSTFWTPIGEALLIAGLLALVVDRALKREFLKEASRGVFHLMLGFDLPPKIRERVKEIVFGTKLYREGFEIKCRIERQAEGTAKPYFESSYYVVNPTPEDQKYCHRVQFEEAERPSLEEFSFVFTDGRGKYQRKGDLSPNPEEPEVLERTATVTLRAETAEKYKFVNKFTVTPPEHFYMVQNFAYPTMGACLEADSTDYDVTASPADIQQPCRWQYNRLFMPGEHIQIRWRPASESGRTQFTK